MDANLHLLAYAEKGNARTKLFAKTLEGVARLEIGIDSGGKRASILFHEDEDGKPQIRLDAGTIDAIAEKLVGTIAQVALVCSGIGIQTGEANIQADKKISLVSDQLLNLGASSTKLGGDALDINYQTLIKLVSKIITMEATSQVSAKAPNILLDGTVTLGKGQTLPIARQLDPVVVMGVKPGEGVAQGYILKGGSNFSS